MALRTWGMRAWVALAMVGGVASGTPVWAFEDVEGDRPMTRRELLQVLYPMVKRMEAQGAIVPSQSPAITTYADLEGEERDWAIDLSGRFHLFMGVPALTSGRFNASLPVSRWEAAMVLGELLRRAHPEAVRLLPPGEPRRFSDLTLAEGSRLQPVVTPGLFIGYPDQTFRTQEPLTHAHWARIADQLAPLGRFQAPAPAPAKPAALKDEFKLLK